MENEVAAWHTNFTNDLIRHFGYSRYLEIGVRDPTPTFDRVIAPYKDGVDPSPLKPCRFEMSSDDFFERVQPKRQVRYDIVFIDGLHLEEQVLRDVANSLKWLAPRGTILIHDCNPLTFDAQIEEYDGVALWNGTVWRAFARLRSSRSDLFMLTVDADHGVGVIQRGSQEVFPLADDDVLDFPFLEQNRKELLNLVPPDRISKIIKSLPMAKSRGRSVRAAYGYAQRALSKGVQRYFANTRLNWYGDEA